MVIRVIFLLSAIVIAVRTQRGGVQVGLQGLLPTGFGGRIQASLPTGLGGGIQAALPTGPTGLGGGLQARLPSFQGVLPGRLPVSPGFLNAPVGLNASVGITGPSEPISLDQEWSTFKNIYNKTYPTALEENFRRSVFIENFQNIQDFNREYGFGRKNFVQQLNNFADLLNNEFNGLLNGFRRSLTGKRRAPPASTFIPAAHVAAPDYIDWREVGAVSPVKQQGSCAGCWAFSAAGALEAHNFRRTGNLVELSPQNLIDCSTENDGCQGGTMEPAYQYVKENPGIDTEESYPYEGKDGPCRFRNDTVGGICSGYVTISPGDEKQLENAVATLGPVSAAIDAARRSFQFYSDGVYYDPECSSTEVNHAILVVGYGVEPNGQKYWLVKNSYGPTWGNGGYVKMAKDVKNHCGIATQASYPLV